MIATGVNEESYREILGMMLGDSKSEASGSAFFSRLKSRDLRGTDIVVSDSHSGLVKVLKAQFQGCTGPRCQTHFLRNFLGAPAKTCTTNGTDVSERFLRHQTGKQPSYSMTKLSPITSTKRPQRLVCWRTGSTPSPLCGPGLKSTANGFVQ